MLQSFYSKYKQMLNTPNKQVMALIKKYIGKNNSNNICIDELELSNCKFNIGFYDMNSNDKIKCNRSVYDQNIMFGDLNDLNNSKLYGGLTKLIIRDIDNDKIINKIYFIIKNAPNLNSLKILSQIDAKNQQLISNAINHNTSIKYLGFNDNFNNEIIWKTLNCPHIHTFELCMKNVFQQELYDWIKNINITKIILTDQYKDNYKDEHFDIGYYAYYGGKYIDDKSFVKYGGKYIDGIKNNKYIKTLQINTNNINNINDMLQNICDLITDNKTITKLNLDCEGLGCNKLRVLTKALSHNTTICNLKLRYLTNSSASKLCKFIHGHKTITQLSMTYCKMSHINIICDLINDNHHLKKLMITKYHDSDTKQDYSEFISALENNHTILSIIIDDMTQDNRQQMEDILDRNNCYSNIGILLLIRKYTHNLWTRLPTCLFKYIVTNFVKK